MIATVIVLLIAFWLVALLIAAVADHPWLLLLPLLLGLGIAGLAAGGNHTPAGQPVLPPLPNADWTALISAGAIIIGLLGAIAVTALIVDGLWRRASSEYQS